MVMEPKAYEWHNQDSRITGPIDAAYTLNTNAGGREGHLVVEEKPVICLQGNGIDRADTAGCNGAGWREDKSYTLNTIDRPAVAYGVTTKGNGDAFVSEERHTALAGGGGQAGQGYPCVAYGLDRASFNQGQNAKFDFTVTEENQPTLTARGPGAVAQPVINASKASFFMRATENGSADTLVATDYKDPQLVAYGIDPGAARDVGDLFIKEQSKTITNGSCPGHHNGVVVADKVGSLCATDYKGIRNQDIEENKAVIENHGADNPHYIVRRLTPTECARLQGFADRWGDIDAVDRMSAKDYQFWKEVRNTHAAINGKKVQDYTVKQMVAWYNKLQTDSAEYKMWGNGIALPTALYAIQGIADALNRLRYDGYNTEVAICDETEDDSWMY